MDLRHGFRRITLVPAIIGSILGVVGGVAIVLHVHDKDHKNLFYLQLDQESLSLQGQQENSGFRQWQRENLAAEIKELNETLEFNNIEV